MGACRFYPLDLSAASALYYSYGIPESQKEAVELSETRMGRPPKSDPKRNPLVVKLSDEDLRRLNFMCEVEQTTKPEFIRKCLDEVYWRVKHLDKKQSNKLNNTN